MLMLVGAALKCAIAVGLNARVFSGGGLAGLSASIAALEAGASRVVLVEKERDVGGNSAKASSGINAYGTHSQRANGVADDTADLFYRDTLAAGDRENDATLVDILVSAMRWTVGACGRVGDILKVELDLKRM